MIPQPSTKQDPSQGPAVSWHDHTSRLEPGLIDWLSRQTSAALAHLRNQTGDTRTGGGGEGGAEVRVAVVNDAEMTAAHTRFMGINETTDVLTFDLRDPSPQGLPSGPLDTDIMVCLDEAQRRAESRSKPSPEETRRELLLYALHGILHCLGHDDHNDNDYDRMHSVEDQILTAIGVGPVFTADPSS